jgi:hypothetical protein
LDVVLAAATVPFVVVIEGLRNSEFLEAVQELNSFSGSFEFVHLLPCISCSKGIEKMTVDRRVPVDFELDILSFDLSIVDIEGVVALNLAHVHEALHVNLGSVAHGAVITLLLRAVAALIVVVTYIHKAQTVRHVINFSNIFVTLFSLTVNQAREAHIELLLQSESIVVSSGEDLTLIPATRSVGECREVST